MMAKKSRDSVSGLHPMFAPPESDDLSGNAYRILIGCLGAALPLVVWLVAGLRHTDGLARWNVLTSISSYYYTGAAAVLVGILVSLGLYLLSYQGYDNDDNKKDRLASRIAGFAALIVAAFPTSAPTQGLTLSWWRHSTGAVHYAAAAILFLSFSYFSLFLFTKSIPGAQKSLPKQRRNRIYVFCGIFILACIAWIAFLSLTSKADAEIFLPEALALEAFALSWLVKGRADKTAAGLAQRAVHYGRNPGQLLADIRGAIGG